LLHNYGPQGCWYHKVSSVYSYVRQASALSQNYYPERLGRLYLINAPWGFSSVFSVIKGFLDPVTVEKIHVLGAGYQKELLAQVPAENLPKIFGGQCECPGGCAFSDKGPWTDPKYTKPPKWQQSSNQNVIDNEATNQGITSAPGQGSVPGEEIKGSVDVAHA